MKTADKPVIQVKQLHVQFGQQVIFQSFDLEIARGEIVAIIGGSGSGKSTLLRCLLHLLKPQKGSIELFGQNIHQLSNQALDILRKRWGVLFQSGALFSSLTVLENILFVVNKHLTLPASLKNELAYLKIQMAGLAKEAAHKYPAQLSGGMLKRAALARAIALDPEILFLDEPSSGLDPVSAEMLDNLILDLRAILGLTVVVITHDVASLQRVDRIVFLGEGKILAMGTLEELRASQQPAVHAYFHTARTEPLKEGHDHG